MNALKNLIDQIDRLIDRIYSYFISLPLKSYILFVLEMIGLFANLIAIISFIGAKNTSTTSPNFYINNQEFIVYSLIAIIYTFGLFSAKLKRRWRTIYIQKGNRDDSSYSFFLSDFLKTMFLREFSFTLVVTFPFTFIYIRAMHVANTSGASSPWFSLTITVLCCWLITFIVMIVSYFIDNALSLYSGE